EAALAPDAAMTSAEIYAYAERHALFHTTYGVCAGPKAKIDEFLRVLVDGHPIPDAESVVLDGPVQAALDELEAAFDYCLYGLQAHALVFSLWPAMRSTSEQRPRALVAQGKSKTGAGACWALQRRAFHTTRRKPYVVFFIASSVQGAAQRSRERSQESGGDSPSLVPGTDHQT